LRLADAPRRWPYATDASYVRRGVYVDDVRIAGELGVLLDGERHLEVFVARGWSQAGR